MSAKGNKKKGKAMTLSEFHSIAGPANETTASNQPANLVRLNWADEMEKLDDDSSPAPNDLVFDRSKLPTAPKAALMPDVDLQAVPKNPPFTAYVSNISFEADEDRLRAFFKDSKIDRFRIPNEKGHIRGFGLIDFVDRESLINALYKNETEFMKRPIKVSLETKRDHTRQGERGGGNGGASDGGVQKSDEADWRRREPEQEEEEPQQQQQHHQYQHHQQQGGYNNQQQQQSSYNRPYQQHYQQNRQQNNSNYQPRNQRNPNPWTTVGAGGHLETQQNNNNRNRNYQNYNQNRERNYNQERRPYRTSDVGNQENSEQQPQQGEENRTVERPKVVIKPRTIPVEESSAVATQSAIFGGAKPVNTAVREREIEEKLKEAKEKEKSEKNSFSENPEGEEEATTPTTRTHKLSTTSSDYKKSNQNKPRRQNRNSGSGISQSSSFTSPPHHQQQPAQQQQQQPQQQQQRPAQNDRPPKEFVEAPAPAENAWQSKPSANLFTSQQQTADGSDLGSNANASGSQRTQTTDNNNRRPYNNNRRVDSSGGSNTNRSFNRDNNNKDRRPNNNRYGNKNNNNNNNSSNNTRNNDKPNRNHGAGVNKYANPAEFAARAMQQKKQEQDSFDDLVGNKFSGLEIDVDDM